MCSEAKTIMLVVVAIFLAIAVLLEVPRAIDRTIAYEDYKFHRDRAILAAHEAGGEHE